MCLGDYCLVRQRNSRNKWDVTLPWPATSWFKVTFRWHHQCQNSSEPYFRKEKNKCVKVVYFPIWYKWQGWNENPGVSMKIYHLFKNPIIRHSGSSISEKLPILRVIITIQHANCFSIRRLCFQWVLLSIGGLHLNCYLMKANLIKGQHHLSPSIDRKALSEALKFGNILVNRLLLKYCIFQGHS